jgi:GH43 family beta-xylosidase
VRLFAALGLAVLGAAALATTATTTQAAGLRNPLLPQTAAGDDSPDPWIFRDAGRYYATYTTTDHIEVRSARDLTGLADASPRRLWPRRGAAPEPQERCCALWAPEIHRLRRPDGQVRWYLYYAANGPAGDTHRMYVLQSAGASPLGPYSFKARLKLPQPFAIDGTVATVGRSMYLIYSGGPAFTPTSLLIARLGDPWTVAGTPVPISSPTLAWEQGVFAINEGPEVLRRKDRLHVIYSASWCGTKAYTLGRLTVDAGDDLLSPRTWARAKAPQPVFATSAANGVFGPGHGSFFSSPDGRESWMAYHATDADDGCFTGGVRTTRAQPFTWTADGLPRFGTPAPLDRDLPAPAGDPTIALQAEDVTSGELVTDRRLVGYRGRRAASGAVALAIRAPHAGRYAVVLRVLGADGAVTLQRLGVRRLPARTTTLTATLAAPLILDEIRLTRRG